jgi:hypothetical protein
MSITKSIKVTSKKIWNSYTEAMNSYNDVMVKYYTCTGNKKNK